VEMRRVASRFVPIFVAMAALMPCLVGCIDQKGPARLAIDAAESAVRTIAADAQKYTPTQYTELTMTLDNLKASYEKGDYHAIVTAAPAVMNQVKAVESAAIAKKDEAEAALKSEWSSLSDNVPSMIAALQSRVDILSKAKKLPATLSTQNFELVKSGLSSMKELWSDASSAFSSGDVESAVHKAKSVQDKGNQLLSLLGMAKA
jgi:hypothetical protein